MYVTKRMQYFCAEFLSRKKKPECVMTGGRLVGRPAGCAFFQHHKHDECQTQCYLLVGHSVTVTIFQGHSSVKQF